MKNEIKLKLWLIKMKEKIYRNTLRLLSVFFNYINLARLKKRRKRIKVGFLVQENQKWNCDSLIETLNKNSNYEPFVIVTKLERQGISDYLENINFFETRSINVIQGYNVNIGQANAISNIDVDIVFIQQPTGFIKGQKLFDILRKSLICYIPYGLMVANNNENHYNKVTNDILWRYYAPSKIIKELYLETNKNVKKDNIVVTGHPKLDFRFEKSKSSLKSNRRKKVIYAPHHSFEKNSLNYATFQWNGAFMLDFARENQDYEFVFKPHPRFIHAIIENEIMTKEECEQYYRAWDALDNAQIYDQGDYFSIFESCDLMITDSGSFLAEFAVLNKPIIIPTNSESRGYNKFGETINKTSTLVHSLEELNFEIDKILNFGDEHKESRKNMINEYFPLDRPSSEKIVDDLNRAIFE
ncbi:CDP-glycerol:poly(glycerophosphate) glycerophosphotransferase [Vibrio crassostreae]|nr:CDP-glycerol:poly(glycerophosphate) glycerophosphotransferase [Vibrio crassostreae]ROP03209.1 CDP-glycerol:poly(glycerophosphate) glycerophosphotransferase [Vibrio crassostreae]ROQ72025.1 CDP-glycerol:poly(glycerophosphate) glycerophosphotransferase [Vibrio crassostreae]ROR77634.1 CDP-glycerol:poly(glycerophosphate) glycerophosphotransferase [Vibrio crassostreae]RPE88051.1 CDP-glycerol:poly(glycerophosphate) glycerophosphotransferase [Vibrio crassostreae]